MPNLLFTRTSAYRLLLLLPLIALAGFCVFYLWGNYQSLAGWYESLPGPFYRKPYWREELFTPQVWQTGRLFSVLALVLSTLLGWGILKSRFPPRLRFSRSDGVNMGLLAGFALLLGTYNAWITQLSMDEYQSAMFFMGTHPFRALSHYPVPNNHLLYSALNALFATPETALIWGKVLSVLAYAGVGILIYLWFLELGVKRQAATVLAMLTLVIFPVWGFSGQARSYTLYLVESWWALLLVTRYSNTKDASHLVWYPVAVALGYATLPTFLYFHLGLVVWGIWLTLSQKKLYGAFWLAQFYAVAASFLLLVPLFLFSGLKSVSGHQWITPMAWSDFSFPPLGPFRDYLTGYGKLGYLLGITTVLFVLRLLFSKKTRWIGALFCALWIGCDLIVLYMKQTPFSRQLAGAYAVSVAIALFAMNDMVQRLAGRFNSRWILRIAAIAGFLIAVGVMRINQERLNDALYLYKIRETEANIKAMLSKIPENARVGFTDNAFLSQALWQRSGKNIVSPDNAQYLVQLEDVNPVLPTDSLVAAYINIRVYKKQR